MFHKSFHPVFQSTKTHTKGWYRQIWTMIHIIIHRAETTDSPCGLRKSHGSLSTRSSIDLIPRGFLPLIGLKQLKPAFLKTGKCYEIRFWYFTVMFNLNLQVPLWTKSIANVLHLFRHFPALAFSRRHTCYLSISLWAIPFHFPVFAQWLFWIRKK